MPGGWAGSWPVDVSAALRTIARRWLSSEATAWSTRRAAGSSARRLLSNGTRVAHSLAKRATAFGDWLPSPLSRASRFHTRSSTAACFLACPS
eukprot:6186115-Pleurochrysis_carterae.AAC.1